MNCVRLGSCFFAAVLLLSGCTGGDELPDNERLLEIFREGRTGVWVSGHGTATQVLADDAIGPPRQRVVLRINDELQQVVLYHSLADSERVVVEPGDIVAFQGRYDFNGRGGTISLTHADPDQPGGGGWVRVGERQYD